MSHFEKWLETQITLAELEVDSATELSSDRDWMNHELEIARHEAQGYLAGLQAVETYLETTE